MTWSAEPSDPLGESEPLVNRSANPIRDPESPWTGPNLLTLSRLGWAIVLFACIANRAWWPALTVFGIAALSDWLDGVWARRTQQLSNLGRNLDPLIDKILIGGTFIYLLPVTASGLAPWMVTIVIARELLITGLRSIMEQRGVTFAADRWGKWKMILQCITVIVLLSYLGVGSTWGETMLPAWTHLARDLLLWAMVAVTFGSGLNYLLVATKPPARGQTLT